MVSRQSGVSVKARGPESAVVGGEPPTSLAEKAYQRLADMIIDGEIAPGEPLREMRLAGQLGTSRVPVREALQRLHDDGWLIKVPRSGARVKFPTLEDVDEVFDLRILLEVEAVRLAVRHVSLADADGLRVLVERGYEASDRGDAKAIVDANGRFHAAVAELSQSGLLCQMLAMLDRRVRWLFGAVAADRSGHSLQEHSDLIDALVARESETAMRIIRQHIESTRRALHEHWTRAEG
jgi:DNA-binding GntR family transcriptional regulator